MSNKIEIIISCYICECELKFTYKNPELEIYPCKNCEQKYETHIKTLEEEVNRLNELLDEARV
jgi:transcription elongation factor Elf1